MSFNRSTHAIHSALALHVTPFTDQDNNYTPQTVARGLENMHGTATTLKGAVISTFNATHGSTNIICPVTGACFVPDPKAGYAKNLHLGTTRIWNADGSINESRWQKFAAFVIEGQAEKAEKIVPKSKLDAYLAKCYNEDPEDNQTGRNARTFFSSKYVQGTAAQKAWDEVYDRLTCGWIEKQDCKEGELEPYITLDLIRVFFENSAVAFQKAVDRILPVPKPDTITALQQVNYHAK